ncbi:MAG: hypothetical protein SPI93_08160, partial [Oscillospiraceae bacterium]|nr:hypothetical protein [Oscillospiraceae bacterium]
DGETEKQNGKNIPTIGFLHGIQPPLRQLLCAGIPFFNHIFRFLRKNPQAEKKPRRNPAPEELERAAALSNSKKKDFESEGGTILFVWHILPGMKQHRKDIMATPHK